MKKILVTCLVLLIGLGFSNIKAQSEPANKNLLNPEVFEADATLNSLVTTTPLAVTAGETYTFSMPAQSDGVSVSIHSELKLDIYVDDDASTPVGNCTKDMYVRSCTFTANTDTLIFEMHGGSIAQHFIYYGLDGFQLEQGSVATDYVPYEALETTPPVFGGEATLILGYDQPVLTQTLIDNHVTATDEIDGDLSDSIVVLSDAYTGNKATLGTYPIELYVQDSSGNEATFTLSVKVVDTVAPVIASPEAITYNVNTPSDVDTIITSNATLSDAYDGVITGYTVLQDTYTGNETVLGNALITFEISDASNNKTTHTITITTVDTENPVITGSDALTMNQSDLKTPEALFGLYSVSDNHTANENITFELVSHTIPASQESGEYTMTLRAVDASGNETQRIIQVTIKDDIAPLIRNHSYVKESYKATFDLAAYIAAMEVSDNDSILVVEDVVVTENLYQQGVVGKYTVMFEVSDDALNVTTHRLTIDVVDDVAPVFAFSETIQTTVNTVLNETQLNALIVESENLSDFDAIDYQVLKNTYTKNASNEGNYVYTVEYMNQKGDTVTSSIDIEVLEISDPIEEETDFVKPWLIIPGSFIVLSTFLIIKKRK